MNGTMEATDDLIDDLDIDWGSLTNELFSDDSSEDTLTFNLDNLDQPNVSTSTSKDGTNIEGDSIDIMGFIQSQYGVDNYKETPTASNLIPNNSTATLPRSGQILPPVPKFVSNPITQSSQSLGTVDLPQYNPLQPLQGPQNQSLRQQVFKHKAVQQPQTSSWNQSSTVMFGHQKNHLHHQMPSDQLHSYPKPMVNIQTGNLHNQKVLWQQSNTSQLQQQQQTVQPMQNFQLNPNQSQINFQQLAGTSRNSISEGGAHRFQGMVIGQGRNNQQVQQQEVNVADDLSAPVGFRTPGEFSNPAAWREYAFNQINLMKDRYYNDLVTMKNNARQFHLRATDVETANKYRNVESFLGKLITFLNTPTVDMIPKHDERVYNYMTFIVNYIIKYHHNKSSQDLEVNQQPVDQPPVNQSRGPQLQATGGIRLQQNPQSNIAQATTNLEANMVNFNQNFPSRRPRLVSNSVNNASFQTGRVEQRPPLPPTIGSFKAAQPNVLTNSVNNLGSPMGLLKSTTAVNFPSRLLTPQPTSSHSKLNFEKLKQPMQKANELTESKVGQPMSPLGSRFMNQFHSPQFSTQSTVKPIIQHATSSRSSQPSVLSRQVNVNTVLSPESIARSPFLHASPTTPSHNEKQCSSSLPPLSTEESQKSEILILPGQISDQKADIENQVHDMLDAPRTPKTLPMDDAPRTPKSSPMDAPKTPKSSSMDAPCAEKIQKSQENPHLHLLEVLKALSSNTWSNVSLIADICSAEPAFDIIRVHEPTNYVASYLQDKADFMLEYDYEQEGLTNSTPIAAGPIHLICPNIEDLNKSGFSFEHQNDPERNVRRKLNVTSIDRSYDKVVFLDPKVDLIETSMKKRPKIEIVAILDEVEGINSKLLETSLNVVIDPVKDISILGGHEGIIVRCLYRNVCFPDLFEGASSTTRPEFIIDLLVPADYPDSSPRIYNSSQNTFSHEVWVKMYETIVSRFKRALVVLPEQLSLEEMARHWDSCAHSVITELAKRRGGASFSGKYGGWEDCTISPSGSND